MEQQQCSRVLHNSNLIENICLDENCQEPRIGCHLCISFHKNHPQSLIPLQEFFQNYKKINSQRSNILGQFNELRNQFSIFFEDCQMQLKSFQSLEITSINQFSQSLYNKYVQNFLEFDKQYKDLEQIIKYFKNFLSGINKSQNMKQIVFQIQIQMQKIQKYNLKRQVNQLNTELDDDNTESIPQNFMSKDSSFINSLDESCGNITLISLNESLNYESQKEFFKPLIEKDQFQEIMIKCQELLNDEPYSILPNQYMSMALRMTKRYVESIEYAEKGLYYLVKSNQSFPLLLFNKGDSLRILEKYEEGLNYLNIAIEISNQIIIDQKRARFYRSKGWCLKGLGKLEEAITTLQQCVKLDPTYTIARSQLNQFIKEFQKNNY